MKVKNISARGHWVGDVLIAPGATEEIDDGWASAINRNDLEEVKEAKKLGRPAKADKAADESADAAPEGDGE